MYKSRSSLCVTSILLRIHLSPSFSTVLYWLMLYWTYSMHLGTVSYLMLLTVRVSVIIYQIESVRLDVYFALGTLRLSMLMDKRQQNDPDIGVIFLYQISFHIFYTSFIFFKSQKMWPSPSIKCITNRPQAQVVSNTKWNACYMLLSDNVFYPINPMCFCKLHVISPGFLLSDLLHCPSLHLKSSFGLRTSQFLCLSEGRATN